MKEFDESLAYFWHATVQQMYRELDKMEQQGWLTSESIVQSDKPNKRVYTITNDGKNELITWLSNPEADIKKFMQGKNVFLMRLAFSGEVGDAQAIKLLEIFRDEYKKNMQRYDGVDDAIAHEEAALGQAAMKYWKLIALHGKIMRKARLDWVNQAINMLKKEVL